jgi:hypothetical protein
MEAAAMRRGTAILFLFPYLPYLPCLLGALASWPRSARAWDTAEHQEIGSASYAAACAEVRVRVAAISDADPRVRARLELGCGSSAAINATLYGDGTAIAGDYVGHPSEILSATGAWRFSSRKHYYLLALENSSHVNPAATQTWGEHHQGALDRAVMAAVAEGLPRIKLWSEAVRESAFADHMLHDSFAAGHMGFNRRASSAAAAKRFHDLWNRHGRVVKDRTGARWTTYSDGRLDEPANAEGRKHVVEAATSSVRDLLLTFVLGHQDAEESLTAWRALPFTIEAPELRVDAERLFEGRTGRDDAQMPLAATVLPARKNTVVRANVWAASPFSSSEVAVVATGNVELAVPILPAQASIGAGGTLRTPDRGHAAVLDLGLIAPVALTVDGLISYEAEAGAALMFRKDVTTLLHAGCQANVELGTSLLSVHLGLAELVPGWRTGWYAAVGFGVVLSAAGGGSF